MVNLPNAITLALIAHDRYKEALAYLVLEHRAEFTQFDLLATRGTGAMVRKWSGLKVQLLEHGSQGGDRRLGELAATHEVQAVIFFRDPYAQAQQEPDFRDLLQVC